jgi:hypothetical protein
MADGRTPDWPDDKHVGLPRMNGLVAAMVTGQELSRFWYRCRRVSDSSVNAMVRTHRPALDQPGVRQPLQDPREDRLVGFEIDQAARARDRRMIRRYLRQHQPKKLEASAEVFGVPVEPHVCRGLIQTRVERMRRGPRQLLGRLPRVPLSFAHRHRRQRSTRDRSCRIPN